MAEVWKIASASMVSKNAQKLAWEKADLSAIWTRRSVLKVASVSIYNAFPSPPPISRGNCKDAILVMLRLPQSGYFLLEAQMKHVLGMLK